MCIRDSLYSYSAYDTMGQSEEKYRSALQYLLDKVMERQVYVRRALRPLGRPADDLTICLLYTSRCV